MRTLVDFFLDCCMCAPQEKEDLKASFKKNMEYALLRCEICRNHCSRCLWCSRTWRRNASRILKGPNTQPTRNWRETVVQVSDVLETIISSWRDD